MNRDIDQLFRELNETEPYLNDDGFSEQIKQEVRKQTQPHFSYAQLPILLIATFMCSFICLQVFPVTDLVELMLQWILSPLCLMAMALSTVIFSLIVSWLLATEQI